MTRAHSTDKRRRKRGKGLSPSTDRADSAAAFTPTPTGAAETPAVTSQRLPSCVHRPPCPGCPLYGSSLTATPGWARLQALAASAGIPLQALSGPALGYRHRARLAVRGRPGAPQIGIFAQGSHHIIDIPGCRVHHPTINRVAKGVWRAMHTLGTPPYREQGHQGQVRYLQIAVNRAAQGAQLVVVDRGCEPEELSALMQVLVMELGPELHSLFWNSQPTVGNAILGPRMVQVHGQAALLEQLGGVTACFPPDAFAQANMPLFAEVVDHIHAQVPDGARVVEFYAGVGAIGLGLAVRSRVVVFNELASGSLRGLAMGRALLPKSAQERVQVRAGAAGECTDLLQGADVVIVDPPRKGLDPALLRALCQSPVSQLIYLSCGLPALLRETEALRTAGYRLRQLHAIDLFPNTEHVETLAQFASP